MKGKVICIITIICAMIVVSGSAILLCRYARVRTFSVDEYEEYVARFSRTETTAPIESARDARIAAEQIFRDVYTSCDQNHQPYIVSFDPIAEVWLVEGNYLFPLHEGGVPYVLIRSNGEVIALWHDK